MTFSANYPAIFTYYFEDYIDEEFVKLKDLWDERAVLKDLKIEEVTDKNNDDNIIKIKFKPNYKKSSTRYIILIAQENSDNTLDNFKDPYFITGLLNQRPTWVKVDTIYDIGDEDSINAEVDISDIINEGIEYLVNIISQELRFDKAINYYQPLELIM